MCKVVLKCKNRHCVKSVRIRSYSGPYFPAFGINTDQNNFEYEHFLHSDMQGQVFTVSLLD